LRILYRPRPSDLPAIYTNLGIDYDERVLPSITTEVLKAVVVSIADFTCRNIKHYKQAISNVELL